MTTLEKTTDYRNYLKEVLATRCQTNPRYSLRAFARDLKISPSRLSEVLNGRYGLSRLAASELTKRLGLSEEEQSRFCDLVESTHGRSKLRREEAKARITATSSNYNQLTLDAFKIIADWYHFAILELMQLKIFKNDEAWIAKSLGISSHEASAAIERLIRLGLIEKVRGKLKFKESFNATPSGIPSDAIRKFHQQILEKALKAIQLQTVEERDLSSLILSIDRSEMTDAKAMIKDFRRNFDKRFGQAPKKDSVYCLGIQFFRLTENSILEGEKK